MRHLIAVVAVLVLASPLVGCGGASWARSTLYRQTIGLNPAPRAMTPRPANAVHVYTSGRPSAPYHEVFLLQTEEANAYVPHSDGELLHDLRRRAGRLGCDGLIVLSSTNTFSGVRWRPALRGLRGTCVVYDTKVVASGR